MVQLVEQCDHKFAARWKAMSERLRIFLSSPGDVIPERRRAALVIERLARDYAHHFQIRPYLWEYEPMLASGHFQDNIDPPSGADIMVLILWSRLGTALPDRTALREYHGIDGRTPVTGTEWEFEDALAANRSKGAPDLLTYRKETAATVPLNDLAVKSAGEAQWAALQGFWERHFAERGVFKAAYQGFNDLDQFEAKLEADLRQMIERRIETRGLRDPSGQYRKGNPYRGLAAYQVDESSIFFGRSAATRTTVELLLSALDDGFPFLLVLGASGVGKSSLVSAGIAPSLELPGMTPGIGGLQRASMRPGGNAMGPFGALATALVEALPDIVSGRQRIEDLARHLRAASSDPAYPIAAALNRIGDRRQREGVLRLDQSMRLLVVVDQLEELFTDPAIDAEERKAFLACLEGMVQSGHILIAASMRSDFWYRVSDTPELLHLTERGRRYDLLPADAAELSEMIRRPALAAGVEFGRDPITELPLDAELTQEAAGNPGALPLLSLLLQGLFEADITKAGGALLTSETASHLGGLGGAIAARAEAVLESMGPDGRASLPHVLRLLVQTRPGERAVARVALRSDLASDPSADRLVNAFLGSDTRLLTSDGDEGGGQIRLAHEALLTNWARAAEWVEQNRRDLEGRARLEDAAALWAGSSGAEKKGRLLTGLQLAEGRDLADRWSELSQTALALIAASSAAARRRNRLITAAIGAAAGVVLAGAVSVGLLSQGLNQRTSNMLAAASYRAAEEGDYESAARLAVAGVLGRDGTFFRIDAGAAEAALSRALIATRRISRLDGDGLSFVSGSSIVARPDNKGHTEIVDIWTGVRIGDVDLPPADVADYEISADGSTLAALLANGGVVTRDVRHNREASRFSAPVEQMQFVDHGKSHIESRPIELRSILLSPHGNWAVVGASMGESNYLLNLQTGRFTRLGQPRHTRTFAFSAVGDQLAIGNGSFDGGANLIRTDSPDSPRTLKGGGALIALAFSPDGSRIAGASDDHNAYIWDTASGRLLHVLSGHDRQLADIDFSRDGRRLLTTSGDSTARVWDVNTGEPIALLKGHKDIVSSAIFSNDGSRVATASLDGTACIWDADKSPPTDSAPVIRSTTSISNGRSVQLDRDDPNRLKDLLTHQPLICVQAPYPAPFQLSFSPNGDRLAIHSQDRAQIFTLQPDLRVTTLGITPSDEDSVAFTGDGRYFYAQAYEAHGGATDIWSTIPYRHLTTLEKTQQSIDSDGMAFAPRQNLIAYSSYGDGVQVWSTKTLNLIYSLKSSSGLVSVSPDGNNFAIYDKNIIIFDSNTGKISHRIATKDSVELIKFSHDGTELLTSTDEKIQLWEVKTGRELKEIDVPVRKYSGVSFSPDDKHVAVLVGADFGDSFMPALFDLRTGHRLDLQQAPGGYPGHIAYSPDGRFVAVGGQTTRLWSARTGKLVADVRLQSGASDTVFTRDGGALLLGNSTNLMTWNLAPARRSGRSLLSWACDDFLSNGLSQFTAAELASTPMLDPRLDRDACHPATGMLRILLTLGVHPAGHEAH